ncbi:VOC family protein [Rhodobacteraceae bacterium KMM 6894]|nr:VOC family protein [Rhodobacteraceae bacterium KMM 6894]
MLTLDHLAVAAASLPEGRQAVEEALGVRLQTGGQHPHFGTHNLLLGLEDGLYLEVIAIDPRATPPRHPRWFNLDRFQGAPRLGNWICRTDDLPAVEAALPGLGKTVNLQRGDLLWRMTVPEDGLLPFDNCHPAVIQWDSELHPAAVLTQVGVALRHLVVSHPDADEMKTRLSDQLSDPRVTYQTGPAGLHAEFDTPHGRRVLS